MNGSPIESEDSFNCDISEETIRCVKLSQRPGGSDVLTINRTSGAVSRAKSWLNHNEKSQHIFFNGVCQVGKRQF